MKIKTLNGKRFNEHQNLAGTGINLDDLVEVEIPDRPDDRFYIVRELEDAPWWEVEPKELAQLKELMVAQVKQTAGSMLSATDWKITREAEGVKPCDQPTKDYRAAIRAKSNTAEAAINAAASVDELAELVIQWPKQPEAPV